MKDTDIVEFISEYVGPYQMAWGAFCAINFKDIPPYLKKMSRVECEELLDRDGRYVEFNCEVRVIPYRLSFSFTVPVGMSRKAFLDHMVSLIEHSKDGDETKVANSLLRSITNRRLEN